MKPRPSRGITGFLISLFIFSSLCTVETWASQHNPEIEVIKPSQFNTTFKELLNEFRTNFPQKPSPSPQKEEFETTREFKEREAAWEKDHKKAVTEYRNTFSKTVPVYELHDLEFTFGKYNADKGYFSMVTSSRLYVSGFNPVCDGYKIDLSCPFGPMERYAHITIRNVSIKREKAKKLKAINAELRMRVGFQLIPPFPEDKAGRLHLTIHHLSIYDGTTGETVFTLTDKPIKGITHSK
jgi:hypothetical protein